MTYKQFLSTGASALLLAAVSTSAFAQSSISTLTDEIIVTATKKADAESIQDVPVSISAFNADTLDALNVTDLESLTFSAPNVSFDDIGTTPGTANFSIRGLGINSSIPSIDPTVGVFVDGVYLGINGGVVFDLFDVDSIEVLRGPQGLLFGRNTTGGAVLLNTGNPTDELRYSAKFGVESALDDDRGGLNYTAQGVVSGPIVEGKLNGKVGVYYNEDDGYFENLATNADAGASETTIVRAALEWLPSDTISFLLKGELFNSEGDGPQSQNRAVYDRDSFDYAIDEEGFYDTNIFNASLKTTWDIGFGDGTITNIFGYRDFKSDTLSDIDALPAVLFHSPTESEQDQISNELRYNGTFGQFELTTGLYYFNQELAYTEIRILPPLSPLTFYGGGRQDHQVLGAFGQVDYNLTDKLVLSAGLRYSDEEKSAEVTFVRPRNECSVVETTCPTSGFNGFLATVAGVQEPNGFVDDDSWSNLTPKIGAQYFINDEAQVFANYTKGFRSGGYNFRITDVPLFLSQTARFGQRSFDEEEVDAFEIGGKYQSADRRFKVNAAGFYTDISDMQREVNLASLGSAVSQFIINTADASIYGVELDGQFAVTDSFLLMGNLGLIEAEYDDIRFDISGDGMVNATDLDLELPRVPKATYGVGAVYDLQLSNGSIVSRVNYQHRDRFAYTDNNLGFVQAADIVDGNITWNTPVEGISISIYGKNLLDEVQVGGDTQIPFGGPLSTGQPVPFAEQPQAGTFSPLKKGRRFGIELSIKH